MTTSFSRYLLAVALTAVSCHALSESSSGAQSGLPSLEAAWHEYQAVNRQGKTSYLLDIDNDSLLLRKNDGFYTSGLRLTSRTTLPGLPQATSYGWRLGQEIYTASDIKLLPQQIGRNDHPYAGWLYAGLFRETQRADGSATKVGLDIGCLGPCAGGEWTQTNLHRLLNQPLPRGWASQLHNEFGAVLYGEVAPARWTPASWFDAAPRLHARFGNIYTDAGAGLMLRAGKLNRFADEPAFHAFLHLDGRVVGYNATLQGGYFSGGGRTVEPKRWVGEAEIGVVWNRPSYGIKASIVRRGNEIRDLSSSFGAQNFARLQFLYTP